MKKNVIIIVLSVFVLILIGITFYFWQLNKKDISNLNQVDDFSNKKIDELKRKIEDLEKEKKEKDDEIIKAQEYGEIKWTEVTNENFWKRSGGSGYGIANLKFSYPSDWVFECCADGDLGSWHSLFIKGKKYEGRDAEVVISELALMDCIGGRVKGSGCSLDEVAKVSLKQKFEIEKNIILETAKIDKDVVINKLGMKIECFVYDNGDRDCLIQTNKDLFYIQFKNKSVEFVRSFIGKIEMNR